jgi:Uma2 family endonuclease
MLEEIGNGHLRLTYDQGRLEITPPLNPPDLAIEIDITHRSIPRQPIYGALKVTEIWLYHRGRVAPLHRTRGGKYLQAERSLAFPDLDFALLNEIIQLAMAKGQYTAIKTLRKRLEAERN